MDLEEPSEYDCCGNGCSPCVFDIYQRLVPQQANQAGVNTQVRRDLLSETRFKPFKLVEKHQISDCVFEFRFQAVESTTVESYSQIKEIKGILPYSVGQHLFLRCLLDDVESNVDGERSHLDSEGKERSNENQKKKIIVRAYTPITIATQEENCCFSVFAKLYPNGVASQYLKTSVVGDILYWRGPSGTFKYTPNSFKYILMLSVGTGVAPMISVINFILSDESDETIMHMICGFKSMAHVILRDKLRNMTLYWNFTLEYYFSNPVDSDLLKFGEVSNNGRIDKICVEQFVAGKEIKKILVLICGTDDFIYKMKKYVYDLGIDITSNIYIF